MEYDESEANAGDLIDERGSGGGSGGFGDILGGGGGAGNDVAGAAMGAILGGLLSGRRGKGGIGLLVVVMIGFFLFRACSGGGFDVASSGNLGRIPDVPTANGVDPLPNEPSAGDVGVGASVAPNDPQADDVVFANVVVTNANDLWQREFQRGDRAYDRTKLVLYSGAVATGCGQGSASAGPFYCPADSRVYLDLSFWSELSNRFGAAGDFARAYVIAHEVGHHVQNELGISAEVQRLEQQDPSRATGAGGLSVRLELQADCLAGVWAHARYQQGKLESGDVEEAIAAAGAVGDDTIQRSQVGRVRPDTFTHGTSRQRVKWFQEGYQSGSSDTCDTFSTSDLG